MNELPKPEVPQISDRRPALPTGFDASIRAVVRAIAIGVWTPSLFAVRVLVIPLALVAPRTERALRNRVFSTWAWGVLRIAGYHVRTEGTPPKSPFVLVSNHLSYVDVVVYIALVSGVFISMAEVRSWPILGFMARHMNTMFINRQDRRDTIRVNHAIEQAVDAGYGVTLFPEGTTSTGEDVLPFGAALLEPMARRQIPVHYATIRYEATHDEPSPARTVCWIDDTPFAAHVMRVLRLRRTNVRVQFCDEPLVSKDRKELAIGLQNAIHARIRR